MRVTFATRNFFKSLCSMIYVLAPTLEVTTYGPTHLGITFTCSWYPFGSGMGSPRYGLTAILSLVSRSSIFDTFFLTPCTAIPGVCLQCECMFKVRCVLGWALSTTVLLTAATPFLALQSILELSLAKSASTEVQPLFHSGL